MTVHPSAETQERPKALVAEDNLINQKLVMRLLAKNGYSAVVVENGKKAVDALEQQPFDFVLMDIQMPEMSGVEATVVIRNKERVTGDHIPIIALTANAMKGDRERFLAAGMDEYVSKPINTKRLFEAIESVTEQKSDGTMNPAESANTAAAVDKAEILERFDNDLEFLGEVVDQFVSDLPALLDGIREALGTGDVSSLERFAHSLKGAASNFGEGPVVDVAFEIEQAASSGKLDTIQEMLGRLEAAGEQLGSALRALCGQQA